LQLLRNYATDLVVALNESFTFYYNKLMKPSLVRGTRDFGPVDVKKRQYIIDTIRDVYEHFGYQPLQTPSMEKISTLLGNYGEEGDKLLFRILNSGDYLRKVPTHHLTNADFKAMRPAIAEKGLRYDLTVPFARYVAMNRGTLTFPFKRYQIQAVWRADKPQRGRYREFFQCDADVIGSESLVNEAELVQIFARVYKKLGLNVCIRVNSRKILAGLAAVIGSPEQLMAITITIDKLDKIGLANVLLELQKLGLDEAAITTIANFLAIDGTNTDRLDEVATLLANSETGLAGVAEMRTLFDYLSLIDVPSEVLFDATLARGLGYYTGPIFEVVSKEVKIGSIGGGGRYDDLTGAFGVKNMSGVGISFGLDRIYDVMEALHLFENVAVNTTQVLFINEGGESFRQAFTYLQAFRNADISAEIYPDPASNWKKKKRQMKFANAKNIPFLIFNEDKDMAVGKVTLKNMLTGEQEQLSIAAAIAAVLAA